MLLALHLLIQIPSDFSVAEQKTLLTSCTQMLEKDVCLIPDATQEPQVRLERLSDERFMMEITVETERQQRLVSREFVFKPEDDPVERARTLGLSVGLLAKTSQSAKASDPASVEQNEQSAKILVPEKKVRARPRVRGDLPKFYAEFGMGLGYEVGLPALLPTGEIRLAYQPAPAFSLLVSAYLAGNRVERAGTSLMLLPLAPLIGFGYEMVWRRLSLGLQLEAGAECIFTSSSTSTSWAARWAPIIRGGVPLHVQVSQRSYLTAAFRLNVTLSTTEVYLDETALATTQTLRPSALLGFGVKF